MRKSSTLFVDSILIAAITCIGGAHGQAAGTARPNIIIVLADDLGYGDLGCQGNPRVQTPHLDAFSRQAVQLTHFYVSPVCAPTRASLMTGRYNFRTGVCDVFGKGCNMDSGEETVAEVLRRAGYATGQFGKWHLGDDPARSPNAQGFDVALTFHGPAMGRRQYFNPTLLLNGATNRYEGYCMDIFTDAALAFIKQHRAKPFFVYLAANLIHTPLVVDEALAAPYADLGTNTARVYGMIKSLDTNFGRLRATLKEAGIEENTFLIFTSDNGPCSGSVPTNRFMAGLHGLKGTVYDNGIRVPFFARWPAAFDRRGKVDRLTAHLDLMPTILEACGSAPPPGVKLDGMSFLPLLRDARAPWPERTLFFQWDSGQAPRYDRAWCAVTEHYKLVQPAGMDSPAQQHIRDRYAELCALQGRGRRSLEGPARYELYDLAADPGETTDLAAKNPGLVAGFRKKYAAWFDEVCARWPRAEQ